MNDQPHRLRFSLRTLFVVVTVVGAGSGWVGYQLNWIRQRHEIIAGLRDNWSKDGLAGKYGYGELRTMPSTQAPGLLGLFGESGIEWINVYCQGNQTSEFLRVQALFPEATVSWTTPSEFPGTFRYWQRTGSWTKPPATH